MIADQLASLGYRNMKAKSLKPKHVIALTNLWNTQGISIGSQKNRLSTLRWWAKKIGKQNVIAKNNNAYGIESRTFVANRSKSQELDLYKLTKISDPRTTLSLRLQAAFGLRREEAIKFRPRYAIQEGYIRLKSSCCKGGSLIHSSMNYAQQLHRYEGQTLRAGFSKLHGLRHGYAQRHSKRWPDSPARPMAGRRRRSSQPNSARSMKRRAPRSVPSSATAVNPSRPFTSAGSRVPTMNPTYFGLLARDVLRVCEQTYSVCLRENNPVRAVSVIRATDGCLIRRSGEIA